MIARWHQCGTMTSQMLARASFSAVCLTVLPFEFRPRTFTIGFYGKKLYHIRAYDFGVQFSFKASTTYLIDIREVPRSADYEYEYVWVSRILTR